MATNYRQSVKKTIQNDMNTAVIETISIPWNMEVKTGNYTQDYEDKNEVVSSRVVTTQY